MTILRSLCIGILTFLPLCGCSPAPDPFHPIAPGQLKVLASFPPLYCFAANVAGDQAKVLCFLTKEGPHDFHATALDSLKVTRADVFFVNGLTLDDFATKLVSDARGKSSVVFKVGEKLPDAKLIHLGEGEHKHVHADGSICEHGEHDPHVWLGHEQAKLMVDAIAEKLSKMKPEHKTAFEERAAAYKKELSALHAYGLEKLKGKANRRVILTHDFLRYFAEAHKIEIAGTIQPTPGAESDSGQLAKLVSEKDVHVIVVEPQYSKASAETLQREFKSRGIDVRLVEFDPLETAQPGPDGNPDPGLYVRTMKKNIDNLAGALP